MNNKAFKNKKNTFFIAMCVLITLLGLLFSDTDAQKIMNLHEQTLSEITKSAPDVQIAHIDVGDDPRSLLIYRDKIYVSNFGDGTVSIIDANNNTKLEPDIKVGRGPSDMAIDPSTNTIYVINSGNTTISAIDANKNVKLGSDINVSYRAEQIIYHPSTEKMFIRHYPENNISVIEDGQLNSSTIEVGEEPNSMGFINDMIYVSNSGDGTVSIIDANNNTKLEPDIKVGGLISDLAFDPDNNTIYVLKSSKNISVIDGKDKSIKDIEIGNGISNIVFDPDEKILYASNSKNGSIIVIDTVTYNISNIIDIGRSPTEILVDPYSNFTYMLKNGYRDINSQGDAIAVIDTRNNTKVEPEIQVGGVLSDVAINPDTNTAYFANSETGSVSVIDQEVNKVVARVMFHIEPLNSGRIECDSDNDKVIVPLSKQFYLYSGSECIAKAAQGFEFLSWQEKLNGDSTIMKQSSATSTFLDLILQSLHLKSDKPEATLKITKFGNFTANFKELPQPIPSEYLATLFAVVISAFVGTWLTPTVIEWRKFKKQGKKLKYNHQVINSLHIDGILELNDINKLDDIRNGVIDDYTTSKITKDQYETLLGEISIKYRKIFDNEVTSLEKSALYDNKNELLKLKNKINDSFATEKINEKQYNLLKERLSNLEKK
jgi:YVTN family beta-propeller protein